MDIKPLDPAPYGFKRDDLIASVAREVAIRKRLYPIWVKEGKIKMKHAQRELGLMMQVEELIKAVTYRDNAELAVGALWIELKKYMCFEKCLAQFNYTETGIMQKNIAAHLRDVVYKSGDYDKVLDNSEPEEDEGAGIL